MVYPIGGFQLVMVGTPSSLDGLFQGKSHLEMDDEQGYPIYGNPLLGPSHCTVSVHRILC